MFKIIKSVSLNKNPVIIAAPETGLPPAVEEEEDCEPVLADESVQKEEEPASPSPEEIIEEARVQAKALIDAAQEQIENQRSEAYEGAYRQGYQNGLGQVRQAIDDATNRAREITDAAEQEAAQKLIAAEWQMVQIAMAVARKIISRELEDNPDTILSIVRSALERVHDQDKVAVRVSIENMETVKQAKAELQSVLSKDSSLTISGDEALKNGDCVVETPFGAVDACVDTQLDNINSALQEAVNE